MKLIVKKIDFETGNTKSIVFNIKNAQEVGQKTDKT